MSEYFSSELNLNELLPAVTNSLNESEANSALLDTQNILDNLFTFEKSTNSYQPTSTTFNINDKSIKFYNLVQVNATRQKIDTCEFSLNLDVLGSSENNIKVNMNSTNDTNKLKLVLKNNKRSEGFEKFLDVLNNV